MKKLLLLSAAVLLFGVFSLDAQTQDPFVSVGMGYATTYATHRCQWYRYSNTRYRDRIYDRMGRIRP